jgi:catechol 2,3-dioxygenase-like lactoylglutathione lyase family enzyme
MKPTQINVVFYGVSDADRSVAFYRDFGLEPGARYGGWQEMAIGGTCRFALHGGRPDDVAAPNAQVSFQVDDLGAAVASVSDKGHEPIEGITDTGYNRFTTYSDPDGNVFQVIE